MQLAPCFVLQLSKQKFVALEHIQQTLTTQESQNQVDQQPQPVNAIHPQANLLTLGVLIDFSVISENQVAAVVSRLESIDLKISVGNQKKLHQDIDLNRSAVVLDFVLHLDVEFTNDCYEGARHEQRDKSQLIGSTWDHNVENDCGQLNEADVGVEDARLIHDGGQVGVFVEESGLQKFYFFHLTNNQRAT